MFHDEVVRPRRVTIHWVWVPFTLLSALLVYLDLGWLGLALGLLLGFLLIAWVRYRPRR
jgi:hypothetical protein